MATFVTLYRFTENGARELKESPRRIEAIKKAYKEAGTEVKQFYALMGQYDTMIVAEAPSEEVMMKLNVWVDSMGYVSSQTMRAFNEAEWKKMCEEIPRMMKKAA